MATLNEKKAFLASRGVTAATMVVAVNSDQSRSMTEQEFDEYVANFVSDPEDILAREALRPEDVAWFRGRTTEYPKTDPQFDAIFHGFKHLRDVVGLDIGEQASDWVSYVQSVKDKYPKP